MTASVYTPSSRIRAPITSSSTWDAQIILNIFFIETYSSEMHRILIMETGKREGHSRRTVSRGPEVVCSEKMISPSNFQSAVAGGQLGV